MSHMIMHEEDFNQKARPERKHPIKNVVVEPLQSERHDHVVTLRVDRLYKGTMRITQTDNTPANKKGAIEKSIIDCGLGEEISPGIRIVEYEHSIRLAIDGAVNGDRIVPSFPEAISHTFVVQINGMHLCTTVLTDIEKGQLNWKNTLDTKVRTQAAHLIGA